MSSCLTVGVSAIEMLIQATKACEREMGCGKGGGERLLITSIDPNQAVCALPRCSLYVVVSILDGTVSWLSFHTAISAIPA